MSWCRHLIVLACLSTLFFTRPIRAATSEVEPNDALGQSQDVSLPAELTGTIHPAKDVDYYRFTFQGERKEVIMAVFKNPSAKIAPNILVYNDQSDYVAVHYGRTGEPEARLSFGAEPGKTYTVCVFSNSIDFKMLKHAGTALRGRNRAASQEPYHLFLRKATTRDGYAVDGFEPNDTIPQAKVLNLDKPVLGTLEPAGDVDIFRLDIPFQDKQVIRISMINGSDEISPNIVLADAAGVPRLFDWRPKGSKLAGIRLVTEEPTVVYVHVFSNHFNWGKAGANLKHIDKARSSLPYKLQAVRQDYEHDPYEPNDTIGEAKAVGLGRTQGTIQPAFDQDWFRVKTVRDGRLLVTMINEAPEITPHIRVFNQDRESLGDDRGRNPGARRAAGEIRRVKAGEEYFIQVYSGVYRNSDAAESSTPYVLDLENPAGKE